MANKPVVPSTTQNNWNSLKSRIDSALNEKKVKSKAKVVKAASVTQHAQTVAEKFVQNQKRINDPEFDAKRRAGLQRYWEKRRQQKHRTQVADEYRERNGLAVWSVLVPPELQKAFKEHCRKNRLKFSATVCELLLEFITKPESK